jgi:hypothetical protein
LEGTREEAEKIGMRKRLNRGLLVVSLAGDGHVRPATGKEI